MIGIASSVSGPAKAKDLQDSLSHVVNYTQENLDRLLDQKPNHHSHPSSLSSSTGHHHPSSSGHGGNGGGGSGGLQRTSSSGRLSSSAALYTSTSASQHHHQHAAPHDYDTDDNHSTATGGGGLGGTGTVQDRKVELLMKKMKVVEDRCKRYDKDITQQQQQVTTLSHQTETIQESLKQEKKSLLQVKEQLSFVKQRVDLLMSQEEVRNRYQQTTNGLPSTGSGIVGNMGTMTGQLGDLSLAIENNEWLKEFIQQRVHAEVSKAIDTYHYQQSVVMNTRNNAPAAATGSASTSSSVMMSSNPHNRQLVEQLTVVEKEMLKLTSDFERLKSKQLYLDRIYSELKEINQNKEQKIEENARKVMNSFRHECDLLIKTTSKAVNDYLQQMQKQSIQQDELQSLVENSIDKTGKILAEFDERIVHEETQQQVLSNTISLLKNKEMNHESRLKEMEVSIPSFLQECEQIYQLKDSLHDVIQCVENQRTVVQQHINHTFKDYQQYVTEKLEQPLHETVLKQQIPLLTNLIKSQQEEMKESLIKYQESNESNIHILKESQKKLKAKLRDLYDTYHPLVPQLQQSMEKVIQDFQKQVMDESSRAYEMNSTLQRIEGKVNQVEMEEKHLKSEVMLSVAKSMEDFHGILMEFKQG
jgi:hypothetical protein